jgi:lipopolysaccharide/colanic/teichoic acid biosynthesis glycosyltransferase
VLSKRLLDVVISGALLLLAAPIVLVILAAFALNMVLSVRDRGSVFYREPRISRGRTFGLLKFRTLRHDVLAEMHRVGGHARLYEADPANLTWVGRRILKPWYLDEIPQLWNVLLGEISLVGPRPWPPKMVAQQLAEGLTYRNEVPAGLTGPAQVTKGSKLRYADLDLTYVQRLRTLGNLSLLRYDLGILWRTVAVIARGEGLRF